MRFASSEMRAACASRATCISRRLEMRRATSLLATSALRLATSEETRATCTSGSHFARCIQMAHLNGSFEWLICASRTNESPRNERLATCISRRLEMRRATSLLATSALRRATSDLQFADSSKRPLCGSSKRPL